MMEPVAIVGAYHTDVTDAASRKLEDLIFEATDGALRDAGLQIADIDTVVLSTADQLHGRVIEAMVTAGAAGAVGRDLTSVPSAGEHALVYGWMRLLAGQGRRVLVVCWGKPSESRDPHHPELVSAEPFMMRPFGLNETIATALQASAYTKRYGIDPQAVERVRQDRADAASRYFDMTISPTIGATEDVGWPLTRADLPRSCDMAIAAVLASGEPAKAAEAPAWISGMGWATDKYDLGTRDLSQFPALHVAANKAGVGTPDVVEILEISTVGGFAALEALGLAESGLGARLAGGGPVINPSGGNLPMHPGNAAGFLRMVMAAQQLRGRAGGAQVSPVPRSAIGATVSGFAGQSATVARFTTREEGVR